MLPVFRAPALPVLLGSLQGRSDHLIIVRKGVRVGNGGLGRSVTDLFQTCGLHRGDEEGV
ncbi:hypothetical protein LDENG_00026900 [Lucifuga dentata]|nr:hypothetical protein LDENG_00026900 [Lucifuga dentata]